MNPQFLPSSSTGLGVFEPKRSNVFKISSEDICLSFPEYLSISFSLLNTIYSLSWLHKSPVLYRSAPRSALQRFGIHLVGETKILQAQIYQVVIKSNFLLWWSSCFWWIWANFWHFLISRGFAEKKKVTINYLLLLLIEKSQKGVWKFNELIRYADQCSFALKPTKIGCFRKVKFSGSLPDCFDVNLMR